MPQTNKNNRDPSTRTLTEFPYIVSTTTITKELSLYGNCNQLKECFSLEI